MKKDITQEVYSHELEFFKEVRKRDPRVNLPSLILENSGEFGEMLRTEETEAIQEGIEPLTDFYVRDKEMSIGEFKEMLREKFIKFLSLKENIY